MCTCALLQLSSQTRCHWVTIVSFMIWRFRGIPLCPTYTFIIVPFSTSDLFPCCQVLRSKQLKRSWNPRQTWRQNWPFRSFLSDKTHRNPYPVLRNNCIGRAKSDLFVVYFWPAIHLYLSNLKYVWIGYSGIQRLLPCPPGADLSIRVFNHLFVKPRNLKTVIFHRSIFTLHQWSGWYIMYTTLKYHQTSRPNQP